MEAEIPIEDNVDIYEVDFDELYEQTIREVLAESRKANAAIESKASNETITTAITASNIAKTNAVKEMTRLVNNSTGSTVSPESMEKMLNYLFENIDEGKQIIDEITKTENPSAAQNAKLAEWTKQIEEKFGTAQKSFNGLKNSIKKPLLQKFTSLFSTPDAKATLAKCERLVEDCNLEPSDSNVQKLSKFLDTELEAFKDSKNNEVEKAVADAGGMSAWSKLLLFIALAGLASLVIYAFLMQSKLTGCMKHVYGSDDKAMQKMDCGDTYSNNFSACSCGQKRTTISKQEQSTPAICGLDGEGIRPYCNNNCSGETALCTAESTGDGAITYFYNYETFLDGMLDGFNKVAKNAGDDINDFFSSLFGNLGPWLKAIMIFIAIVAGILILVYLYKSLNSSDAGPAIAPAISPASPTNTPASPTIIGA